MEKIPFAKFIIVLIAILVISGSGYAGWRIWKDIKEAENQPRRNLTEERTTTNNRKASNNLNIKCDYSNAKTISINADESVHILITDPLGRKVGYEDGGSVSEIFGASYEDESIDDDNPDDGIDSPVRARTLFIPNPANGAYKIEITGITTNAGIIDIYLYYKNKDVPEVRTINTNLAPGQVTTDDFLYSLCQQNN